MNFDKLWAAVVAEAAAAGLDASKFGEQHRAVVRAITDHLAIPHEAQPHPPEEANALERFSRRLFGRTPPTNPPAPVPPHILCGEPGTGKTTFLYLIDIVLRRQFALPDLVVASMPKADGRQFAIQKRRFNSQTLSLLSVRRWAELLHFYEWSTIHHKLIQADLDAFIRETLLPMRVIFADEVEMTGYSPTIPQLSRHGLLVVGTSNQVIFEQLARELVPPVTYDFRGFDMRSGDPADAISSVGDGVWAVFDGFVSAENHVYENLTYRVRQQSDILFLHLNFNEALRNPLLESEWLTLMNRAYQTATEEALTPESRVILLIDDFSLERLRTDYNGIIRFISLFDAIEQVGVGVKVRNVTHTPELSREAISHMKVTINAARGVPDDIKRKTIVGIDRWTSRFGQAGFYANTLLQ